ncbi:MAG: hypothetical protein OEQ25_17545 [Gammaproteobacteria bacterium]|nr:hypothetical protein [Gammaproteobacteria bacterium]
MIRTLIILVAGLVTVSSSAWAYRVIDQIEDGYELALVMVRLPLSERGTIVFRVCEECNTTALRVTNATRYFANGAPVELSELRELAEAARATAAGRDRAGIFISYDIASLRVNRVRLSY